VDQESTAANAAAKRGSQARQSNHPDRLITDLLIH
jgi:hypothetical protein